MRSTSSTGGQKGVKLARFDLIPARPLELLAEHYGKGAKKYAEHQWRNGFEWSKAIAALHRHMNSFEQGIDYDVCSNDPEGCMLVFEGREWDGDEDTCWNHTGSHHMQAVMWMSFCLMEFIEYHPNHDDRFVQNGSSFVKEWTEEDLQNNFSAVLGDSDGISSEISVPGTLPNFVPPAT